MILRPSRVRGAAMDAERYNILDMRYLVRAIKYFVAFCVLYVGILWLSLRMSGMEVSVWDSVAVTMQTTRGRLLAAAVVVLSAAYPRFGFVTRRVECMADEDAEQIESAFAVSGFRKVSQTDDGMVFRADNIVRRLTLLGEDEITVRQYGQWVEITGIRRAVARVAYRLETYMDNKRR